MLPIVVRSSCKVSRGRATAALHASLPAACRTQRNPNLPPHTGVAAFVESLSEPFYILAATRMLFTLRVAVETAAMSARGLVTLALVQRPGLPPAIAFSWAQLAYATVTLGGYAAYFLPQLVRGAARRQPREGKRTGQAAAETSNLDILRLSGTFTLQANLGQLGPCLPNASACRDAPGPACTSRCLLCSSCCAAADACQRAAGRREARAGRGQQDGGCGVSKRA